MNRTAVILFLLSLIVGYNLYDDFDPEKLVGKRVLVTGASAGIGEQIAYHYARYGAKLLITARTEAKLQKVVERCQEIGRPEGEYHYVAADMGNRDDVRRVIQTAKEVLGGLDFLVLNHIISVPLGQWLGHPDNFTQVDKIMEVNYKAYVRLASYASPMLEESSGSIVVVSSIVGRIGMPYVIPYSASKFALEGFFAGLRQEFYIREIDVSITVCVIGLIGTENALHNLKMYGLNFLLENLPPADPADAALAIVRGGAQRQREIFFPYIEARVVTLLRDLIPNILEAFVRFIYS